MERRNAEAGFCKHCRAPMVIEDGTAAGAAFHIHHRVPTCSRYAALIAEAQELMDRPRASITMFALQERKPG